MADRWLLAISVGPVGGFIGGGRRSRDLWWGSTWVSECARTVAQHLRDWPGAELLVPSPPRLGEIEEMLEKHPPLTYAGRISNHLQAIVPAADQEEITTLARECESLVHQRLADELRGACDRLRQLHHPPLADELEHVLDPTAFDAQVEAIRDGDFVEFFAAWTPFDENNLGGAMERANELLDARKSARLFTPANWSEAGRRKSDLDPGRDSVLAPARGEDFDAPRDVTLRRQLARRRLGVLPDEDLDAVSFGRRLAAFTHDPRGHRDSEGAPNLARLTFPPLGRVAADAWLVRAGSAPATRKALAELREILSEALQDVRKGERDLIFFAWCSPAEDPDRPRRNHADSGEDLFPWDAGFLFEGGIEALEREVDRLFERRKTEKEEALGWLGKVRSPTQFLHGELGVPPPYYALLAVDGDGIGQALSEASRLTQLTALVTALDGFADKAEEKLRQRRGCPFFVGGDELMVYLPIDQALDAARDLADLFEPVRQTFRKEVGAEVSLSGGLVLAHVKADLRGTRKQALDALASAKRKRREASDESNNRGWLEVRELPRAGGERRACGPLAELASSLETWRAELARGNLSRRSPYQLVELHRSLRNDRDPGLAIELARHRLIAQRRRAASELPEPLRKRLGRIESWHDVHELASELMIASRLERAAALRPEPEGVEDE
jgi:CRISPR-associated protein Cmr2